MVFVFRSVAARYCFVEFADDVSARQALESLNNQTIPGTSGVCITNQPFDLAMAPVTAGQKI
jgi:hypothetical protein